MSNKIKCVTGECRLAYVNLAEPRAAVEGQKAKYSVCLIIPKSDEKTVAAIKDAVQRCAEANKALFGGRVPPTLRNPLRDGDVERPDREEFKNAYFVNASTLRPPALFDANLEPILDRYEVKSGDYGRASLTLYAYNTSGNRGIGVGLNAIMKTRDGEPFGGASNDYASDFVGF